MFRLMRKNVVFLLDTTSFPPEKVNKICHFKKYIPLPKGNENISVGRYLDEPFIKLTTTQHYDHRGFLLG